MNPYSDPCPETEPGHETVIESPEVRLTGYEILEELGRGGAGVVFKVRDAYGGEYAMKVLKEDDTDSDKGRKRFDREVESIRRLRHRHIIDIHEWGTFQDRPAYVMELVDGPSLAQILKTSESKTVEGKVQVIRWICQVLEALQFAHSNGFVHRDIKPENILIDARGEARLTDFGLARRLDSESMMTKTGEFIGTVMYMPPEQAKGERRRVGIPSDVYACGAILYEVLTGQPLITTEGAVSALRCICDQTWPLPREIEPGLPLGISRVCLRALRKQPEDRYQSARDVLADLQPWTKESAWDCAPRSAWYGGLVLALSLVCLVFSRGDVARQSVPPEPASEVPVEAPVQSAEVLEESVRDLWSANGPGQALERLDAESKRIEPSESLLALRSRLLYEVDPGKYQAEVEALTRLVEESIDESGQARTEAIYHLASIELREGKFKEALDWAGQGIAMAPQRVDLLKLRAQLYEQIGNSSSAREDLERILEIEAAERTSRKLDRIRSHLTQNRFLTALVELDRSKSDATPQTLVEAHCLLQLGEYELAWNQMRSLVRKPNLSAAERLELANLFLAAGGPRFALESLQGVDGMEAGEVRARAYHLRGESGRLDVPSGQAVLDSPARVGDWLESRRRLGHDLLNLTGQERETFGRSLAIDGDIPGAIHVFESALLLRTNPEGLLEGLAECFEQSSMSPAEALRRLETVLVKAFGVPPETSFADWEWTQYVALVNRSPYRLQEEELRDLAEDWVSLGSSIRQVAVRVLARSGWPPERLSQFLPEEIPSLAAELERVSHLDDLGLELIRWRIGTSLDEAENLLHRVRPVISEFDLDWQRRLGCELAIQFGRRDDIERLYAMLGQAPSPQNAAYYRALIQGQYFDDMIGLDGFQNFGPPELFEIPLLYRSFNPVLARIARDTMDSASDDNLSIRSAYYLTFTGEHETASQWLEENWYELRDHRLLYRLAARLPSSTADELLSQGLASEDFEVRLAALQVIGETKNRSHTMQVQSLWASDPETVVQVYAGVVLCHLREERTARLMEEALANTNDGAALRMIAEAFLSQPTEIEESQDEPDRLESQQLEACRRQIENRQFPQGWESLRSLTSTSNHYQTLVEIARIYLTHQDTDGAQVAIDHAIALDPKRVEAYALELEAIQMIRGLHWANRELADLYQVFPNSPRLVATQIKLLERSGSDIEEIERILEGSLSRGVQVEELKEFKEVSKFLESYR